MNRFALSDFMGFLRHEWNRVHKNVAGGHIDLPDVMNRHPHPAIPWQVAPQQSLPPLHRPSLILNVTACCLYFENHVGIYGFFIGKHRIR